MKKILLLLITLALIAHLFGATPRIPTRELFVFLDYGQSEENMRSGQANQTIHGTPQTPLARLGAITSTVLPAIYQQAGPMIVSRSLLYSLLMRKKIFHDCLTRTAPELNKLYGHQNITQAPSLGQFKQHCIYADTMYKKIKEELSMIFKKGSPQEVDQALTTLTTKHAYLETAAPRSLQYYSSERRSIKEAFHRELQGYALCYYAPLSSEHYIIKEISPELILLVPRSYETITDSSYLPKSSITPVEKKLGLKLNHLQDCPIEKLLQKTPVTYGVPLAQNLREIFITKKEGNLHTWTIYLTGHGLPIYPERRKVEQLNKLIACYNKKVETPVSSRQKLSLSQRKQLAMKEVATTQQRLQQLPATHEKIICSLSSDEFKKVLQFLNTQLQTSLFVYTSCYAGGEHLVLPYQADTETLTFDCVVGSISDEVSIQPTPMLLLPPYKATQRAGDILIEGITENSLDTSNKQLIPYTSVQFKKFIAQTRKAQRDGFSLIQCLHPYTYKGTFLPEFILNIAHVRPAGARSFTVDTTCEALRFLPHAGSLSPSATVCYLAEKHYGSLMLPKIPTFISVVPGPTYHKIKSLSTSATLRTVFEAFLTMETMHTPKLFYIGTLECTAESTPFLPFEIIRRFTQGSRTVLHDVIIARNIMTSDGLQKGTQTNIYFSDERGITWHIPVHGSSLGSSSQTSAELVALELEALFNVKMRD